MRPMRALVLLTGLTLLGACVPPEHFENAASATLQDIDPIRNDTKLTVQQKRGKLAALGLDPLTINALLQSERLGNQFGGDLRTAYNKITGGQMTALTADEVQIYGDEASALDANDQLNVTLTDEEAQAIVTFLITNNLDTRTALGAFVDNANNIVPATIPDGVLKALFVDFDPTRLLPKLP